MTLTAGATLQSNKYVVEAVLNQSHIGTTYRAKHTLLQQAVFLQTFSEAVQQRSDLEQLKAQFMSGVRSLSQQTEAERSQGKGSNLRILDCFEEAGLPYLVLQAAPEPPQLSDWLTLSPGIPDLVPPAKAQPPEVAIADAPAVKTVVPPEKLPHPVAPAKDELQSTVPVAPARLVSLPDIPAPQNGSAPAQMAPAKRRLPVALLITALAGLGLGAGVGAALRYQPPESGVALPRSPKFFSREQSFPSQGDWPITETPSILIPDPQVEEPLYRTVPAPDYYSPSPQPYQSSYPPRDLPAAVETAPLPPIPSERPINSVSPSRAPLPSNPEPPAATSSPAPDSNYSTFSLPELQSPAAADPVGSDPVPPARSPKVSPANPPPIVRQ